MKLLEKIDEKYKNSIKEKDSNAVNTLRLIRSAIKDKQILLRVKQATITDSDILTLLQNLIKQRKDSIEAFNKANRKDLIDKEMAEIEAKRDDGIEALGIMTPSGNHYQIAKEFIKNKVHIICDKPLTSTIKDAENLKKLIIKHKIIFALTHNYSSYPMLREAKEIIKSGKIGKITLVNVEYPQGYTVAIKKNEEKQILKWRLDKNQTGPSMILSEIGTHAYHLLRYVTGLEVEQLSAEVSSLSSEISVDDNAFILLRIKNNIRGSIWVSSAATGGENGLKIRVFGNKGGLEWFQDDANNLKFIELNSPTQIITRASNMVSKFSMESSRVAAGHPEGFFEAFANIYTEFADSINAYKKHKKFKNTFPTIDDGLKGIKFIFAAKNSSNNNSKWTKI